MYPSAMQGSKSTFAIADRTKTSLKSFNDIFNNASRGAEKTTIDAVNDNLSRFRIWAGNIGAYHTDSRSADHRVREAPEIAARIVELLDDLTDTNAEIFAIISGERLDAAAAHVEEADFCDGDEGRTELSELCLAVGDIISSLLKASGFLRKATGRDRYAKAAAAKDDTFSDTFDIQHVAEKFPKVEQQSWLRDRLGRANVQRRQYLRYARKHHEKMAHEPIDYAAIAPLRTGEQLQLPSSHPKTVVSSGPTLTPTNASTLLVDMLPPVQQLEIEHLDDSLSQATSMVTSKVSHGKEGGLDVIELAELSKAGEPFECPYCWTIVQTKRQRSWRKHVLRDIRAWTCTFEDCSSGLFEDRDSWFQHELDSHRRIWSCQSCPDAVFDTAAAMTSHLHKAHGQPTSEALDAILSASSRPATEIPASACPLCDDWEKQLRERASELGISQISVLAAPLDDFRRHLSHHLEQLALFAIPPTLERLLESGSNKDGGGALRDNTQALEQWRDATSFEPLPAEDDQDYTSFIHDDPDLLYTPLNVERKEFRLLSVEPGLKGEPVQCALKHASLLSPPEYETISYDWGLKTLTTISINGKRRNVRRDQEYVLQQVRDSAETRFVWLDEVCINQANHVEKNSQIPLKIEIFLGAVQCLAFGNAGKNRGLEQERRLSKRVQYFDEFHPEVLSEELPSLARMYRRQGRWKEAEKLLMRVMKTRQRILGAEHPDTLNSMTDLVWIYSDQSSWGEAEALQMQVIETRQRILGAEHPDTLNGMTDLVWIYSDQGSWGKAEALQMQVMETRQRVLGAEHLDTLTSKADLAQIYRNQGRWAEAEPLEIQVMETRQRVLGAEHPDTLTSILSLAGAYKKQGKTLQAEKLMVLYASAQKRVLGETPIDPQFLD